MKIKLINVVRLERYTFPPYALGLLNTHLKKKNVDTELFDLDIIVKTFNSKRNNKIDLNYLRKKLWNIPEYLRNKDEDPYLEEQIDRILSLLPIKSNEILAFHIPHTEINFSLLLAKRLREKKHNPIIMGGIEIKRKSEEHLKDLISKLKIDYIDYFVIGEAYTFLNKLLNNELPLFSKTPIISSEKKELSNADWSVPEFNKSHIKLYKVRPEKAKFFFPELPTTVLEKFNELKGAKTPLVIPYRFQFGCNNNCAYCGYNKKPQKLPADKAFTDIEYLNKKYKTNNFYFLNTNIAFEKEHNTKLLPRLKDEFNIKWSDTANINMVTPETIKKFAKSGCIELFMGIATASKKLHNYVGRAPKNNPIRHFSDCFKAADKRGIWTVTDFIFGLPYETNEDIAQTRDFLLDNKKYINGILANRFIMMKGSPFAKNPLKYALRLHHHKSSVDNIRNNPEILKENFGGLEFDELHGLNSRDRQKKTQITSPYFNNLIKKEFPQNIYTWYPIFMLYNNFDSKKDIKKFLSPTK
ncbi:MAG: B12-binding domain-containing radical SAM protein [Candidatus Nanoarchaeia archaeon]